MTKRTRRMVSTMSLFLAVCILAGTLISNVAAVDECSHTWAIVAKDVETHTLACSLCGESQTTAHSYATDAKSYGYVSDDYHSQICSVCNQVYLFAHAWEAGILNLWYWCGGCDTNATNKDYAASYHSVTSDNCSSHTWVVSTYTNNGHTLECHNCGATTQGNHDWSTDADGLFVCSSGCRAYFEGDNTPAATIANPIEHHYSQTGPYAVSSQEFSDFTDPEGQFNHIKIWYPSELSNTSEQWPVIVFCNGTGSAYGPNQNGETQTDEAGYTALFEHFASWGFILVANNRPGSASSTATDTTLGYLLNRNETSGDFFYNKVDLNRIGVAGHSQGGTAVLQNLSGSTVTTDVNITYQYTSLYKAAWSASPQAYDNLLKWTYTPESIQTPTFMVCADDDWASSGSILSTNMSKMSGTATVTAVKKDADHGAMVSAGKGYMIAWFRYILLNDTYAAEAFVGEQELLSNANWQEQATALLPALPEE